MKTISYFQLHFSLPAWRGWLKSSWHILSLMCSQAQMVSGKTILAKLSAQCLSALFLKYFFHHVFAPIVHVSLSFFLHFSNLQSHWVIRYVFLKNDVNVSVEPVSLSEFKTFRRSSLLRAAHSQIPFSLGLWFHFMDIYTPKAQLEPSSKEHSVLTAFQLYCHLCYCVSNWKPCHLCPWKIWLCVCVSLLCSLMVFIVTNRFFLHLLQIKCFCCFQTCFRPILKASCASVCLDWLLYLQLVKDVWPLQTDISDFFFFFSSKICHVKVPIARDRSF